MTGTMSSPTAAVTSSHARSTWSISAMSAMVQPAFRSGRKTVWCSSERMSADSAMKWTPQKTMKSASLRSAAARASLKLSPVKSAWRITSSRW